MPTTLQECGARNVKELRLSIQNPVRLSWNSTPNVYVCSKMRIEEKYKARMQLRTKRIRWTAVVSSNLLMQRKTLCQSKTISRNLSNREVFKFQASALTQSFIINLYRPTNYLVIARHYESSSVSLYKQEIKKSSLALTSFDCYAKSKASVEFEQLKELL